MKRGAKRPALYESATDSTDPTGVDLRSKRVMEAPSLDVHRAEPSHQQLVERPTLDAQRANLSLHYVTALNRQFASWIQSQLENHLDELWEDGVKDYLSHASHIMEEFKDIVQWLRENSTKSQGVMPSSFPLPETSNLLFSSQSKLNSNTSNGFPKMGSSPTLPMMPTPSLFPTSQSSSFFSSNGTLSSVFSGFSSSVTSGEADEEEMGQPSSPSFKKIQETGISIVHEVKCKVYIKPDDPAEKGWKDIGAGHLSIRCKEGAEKSSRESKPTIIVRNVVGRVLLNALIYPGIKMNVQKNSIVSIFHTSGEGLSGEVMARTYLLRLKTLEETKNLEEAIKEYVPSM